MGIRSGPRGPAFFVLAPAGHLSRPVVPYRALWCPTVPCGALPRPAGVWCPVVPCGGLAGPAGACGALPASPRPVGLLRAPMGPALPAPADACRGLPTRGRSGALWPVIYRPGSALSDPALHFFRPWNPQKTAIPV